ncbi:DUF4383 domain-containing protein [Micromonospora echinospora]|uniref:DUF4383 domain-containing protein n=1 Tax=Micromonospora echinospora TaxID=1877 RepID=A0A1C4VGM5_MICEC|nr:DUF4383 domain-containing protein [Micromonospora echinospora]OZV74958.1 DUF4383 domain-containing protein [Micromonospora echinospora]SCE83126.1 Short repeat of unknown function [Micromonospora echinospora]
MPHFPVNHPARPLYRAFAGLVGLYILIFGVWGVVQTWGEPLFDRGSDWVLGLRTNLAFSLASVVFGIVLLIGASRRSNLGHYMNLTAGVVFMVTGVAMMSVLQTDANFLNFSMSTVVVSMIFGLLLLATGLYDKVGPPEQAETERHQRSHLITRPR